MKNDYEVRGDITTIFIKYKDQILETIISTSDLERINEFPNTWHARWTPQGKFYIEGNLPRIKGKKRLSIPFTKWLLNTPKGMVVDHIDRDTLNNTRSNLRIITTQQNLENKSVSSRSKSGVRGVSWSKVANKWTVQVKGKYFGLYENIEDAEKAAIEARKKLLPFSHERKVV